jgi:hypothetical protein
MQSRRWRETSKAPLIVFVVVAVSGAFGERCVLQPVSAQNEFNGIAGKIINSMSRLGFELNQAMRVTVEIPASIWDQCIHDAATPVVSIKGVKFRRVPD